MQQRICEVSAWDGSLGGSCGLHRERDPQLANPRCIFGFGEAFAEPGVGSDEIDEAHNALFIKGEVFPFLEAESLEDMAWETIDVSHVDV